MTDPSQYRPEPGRIPDSPGVYRFRDEAGRVIYVGKAKSLRQRLNNYFQPLASLHPRTQRMVTTAASVEWTVVGTEVEALALEYSWIKEFDPRFNVKYRDDKSYPYLAVTMSEEYPRIAVVREAKKKGTRYFGPYAHAWAIRETVDLLLRVFPVRTCTAGVFRRAGHIGRPCLLGYIDKCSAPCVGRISAEDHRQLASDFCDFMSGETGRFVRKLERAMRVASDAQEYERAARLRDDMQALERAMEKNAVVFSDSTDADVFAWAHDELEAAVQVFHVRGGRIRGERGWVVEKVEDLADDELIERLLLQVYAEAETRESDTQPGSTLARTGGRGTGGPGRAVPREVLVPVLPADLAGVRTWLSGLRGAAVDIRVPHRGEKRELAQTVRRNAEHTLAQHKLRRSSDLTARSQAMRELQDQLNLSQAPLRIECYDISTTQGTHVVASMVVFEDGLPRKKEYRRFIIRGSHTAGATDDTSAIYEVILRRFKSYVADNSAVTVPSDVFDDADGHSGGEPSADDDHASNSTIEPETSTLTDATSAYPPNLVVVDGGAPQVAAAARALAELGVEDVALCGLAKRLEEVWLPGEEYPLILPRTSEGLYLLQRVRDEAHRFAITFHRHRRGKAMTSSALDEVPGLGPARRAAVLKHFGSVKKLRAASVDEIRQVPGIGPGVAAAIVSALAADRPAPAVNTATGELID